MSVREPLDGQAPDGKRATITQATVTLTVVRVGAKQMTKAVYNQLPADNSLPYAGEIWGIVRVCPSGWGPGLGKHVHIIGTNSEGVLCRTSLWERYDRDMWKSAQNLPQLFIAV